MFIDFGNKSTSNSISLLSDVKNHLPEDAVRNILPVKVVVSS